MSSLIKTVFLAFFILLIVDLYNCTIPGQEVSMWLRPFQMFILLIWVLLKRQPTLNYFIFTFSLMLVGVSEYIFYKNGSSSESVILLLLIVKNMLFMYWLYVDTKDKLQSSKKLYRWASNYFFIAIFVSFLISGFDNWLIYLVAIQSGFVLLFISLQQSNDIIFKQTYLGFCLVSISLIFGKILMSDSRWFVEMIARFSFIMGHLFFVSGLAKIKLLPFNQNPFGYQTVKEEQNEILWSKE